MRWKTVHRKLTKNQVERGVIYSSQLMNYTFESVGKIHEVFATDEDKWEKIDRLKDVSFFKEMARDFNCYVENIVRR